MKSYLHYLRRSVLSSLVLVLLIASIAPTEATAFVWPTAPGAQNAEKAILNRHHPLVQEAIGVQDRHTPGLWTIPDVMGTGVGVGPDGLPVIKVFTRRAGVQGIPQWLEAIPVDVEVIGEVFALQSTGVCPQGLCGRPSPIGVSTGHPAITAGTISARVKDADGNVYALSNNHVYANMNNAKSIVKDGIGDSALQPGTYDGGTDPAHKIGTLYDFEPIKFSLGVNYIDAAIVKSSPDLLDNSTLTTAIPPAPAGYDIPNSTVVEPSLNMRVQKYGRTTYLTHGIVSAINVTVRVSYGTGKSAYFYDQIQITPGGFSAGGDSGSLIVTDDANKNPVGLLFAGSSTTTIANRIQRVLDRFHVTIDGEAVTPTPPAAPTDLTASAVSSSQINLTWTDHSNNETGFKIERCTGQGCNTFEQIATVGYNVTSYSNTNLLASTTYKYRVRAYNSSGDSDPSNEASAATPAAPAVPTAPTNLTATAISRSQIDLAWAYNSNNETGFKIERCKGSTCTNFKQIATVGASVTDYSNTSLSRNTTYRYRVRAYNAAGNSGYSETVSATTPLR
jgi:hypothetical protein